MGTCAECGEGMDTTYDCHDCGNAFCVDCRLPDDHDCTPATAAATASDGGTATVESPSVSLPSLPRITVLLPVWRAIPWQIHALAALLLPVLAIPMLIVVQRPLFSFIVAGMSPVFLAQHVYHERVAHAIAAENSENSGTDKNEDAAADGSETTAWTPSWTYYIPLAIMLVFTLISQPSFFLAAGGLFGFVAAVVYLLQKRRHGARFLSR
ncbi:AN1-type zinc finger domain-containing protein [Halorientalis salina]|uniref:AN1-type zinc finger domain-containing protein n=1 Tax=Halorientalis salina TaxID=2932266 RepID=UPI0010ACEC7C|nr:AN1-type zinc finger domain-containing protein [Halorientalis salina]